MLGKWIYSWFRYLTILLFSALLASCGANSSGDGASETENVAISSLTLDSASIQPGEPVSLTAVFSGGTGSIDQGVGAIESGVAVLLCPSASTTYRLSVTSPGGTTVSASIGVTVSGQAVTSSECTDGLPGYNLPPDPDPAPVIHYFTASSSSVVAGSSVSLIASYSNGTGVIEGVGSIAAGASRTARVHEATEYTLTVTTADGQTTQSSLMVAITEDDDTSPISLTLSTPSLGQKQADSLNVGVRVNSTYDIRGVVASIGGQTMDLVWDTLGGRYEQYGYAGTIDISQLAAGDWELTVVGTDHFGNTDRITRTLVIDRPPILQVVQPLDQSVFLDTSLTAVAQCVDDYRVEALTVGDSDESTSDDTNVAYLSYEMDLTDQDGTLSLTFRCTDSSRQTSTESLTLYAVSNQPLTRLGQFTNTVLDFDGQRVLSLDTSGNGLVVQALGAVQATSVEFAEDYQLYNRYAYLTPTGVAYTAKTVGGSVLNTRVFDWNNGELFDLGMPNSATSLTVAGDFAIWNESTEIWRRQFSTRENLLLGNRAGNWHNAVAESGLVAWWSYDGDYSIKRYENGQVATVVDDSYRNTYVITDGQSLVYRKHTRSNSEYALAYHDGLSETLLTDFGSTSASSGRDYQINNGHIAYTDIGGLGQNNVWSRSPDGMIVQRSWFGSNTYIDTLADNGDLILVNGSTRYFSRAGEQLEEIGSTIGTTWYINGQWYLSLGRELFELDLD